jgi:hypothetical protein
MMTEQNDATQADADAQPQAGTSTDQQQASSQAPEPTDIKDLPAWAQKLIKDTRREAGDYRTKAQQYEDANKTEAEKREQALKSAEDRATAAESRYQAAIGRAAVTDAATKAGAISSRAVHALIRDEIDFGDDGEPTNIDALINAARKDEPQLFRAAAGSGDGGKGGDNDTRDINSVFRQMAKGAR